MPEICTQPKVKWYNHEKFSLIPRLQIKNESEYNTKVIYFNWLFF